MEINNRPADALPTLIIEADRASAQYWLDVWRFRELLFFLAWRDLLVRYKQTAVGVAWGVIRPMLTMATLTVVFSWIAKLPAEGAAPYPVMVLAAMLPWQFFANSISDASLSIVGNASLVTKVYFPRFIIPLSSIMVSVADFLIALMILSLVMAWYGHSPDGRIVALPLFAVLGFTLSAGVGIWFSSLSVKYRDFRYVIPFMLQIGLYITPVGFSSGVIPEKWRMLYSLNPMVGVIDGFRWALLGGTGEIYWPALFVSMAFAATLAVSGALYFRRVERSFADTI
ncbi:MAG: ABC transporter permease [Nitrospinae bacterium]|nr:ABC transporter permease [Nitrospinota bacterium]